MSANCKICEFGNPKVTVTAIIIQDQKILVLKRNEEPFKGMWDFPGGYLQGNETREEGLRRELQEELKVETGAMEFFDEIPGTASYNEYVYPVLNNFFLVEIGGKIKLDKKENSAYSFIPLAELNQVAFDTNQKALPSIQDTFLFNLDEVKGLIKQLDETAKFNEQSFYRALLDGHVVKKYEDSKLIGMGWIFRRQTGLRCQAVVEDMIVDEQHRRQGLGKEILGDLIEWAKRMGVEVIELTTNPKRVAANALYRKMNFVIHETSHYLLKL